MISPVRRAASRPCDNSYAPGVVATPTSPVVLTWCNFCFAARNLPIPSGSCHLFIKLGLTRWSSCSFSLNPNVDMTIIRWKPWVLLCFESEPPSVGPKQNCQVNLKGTSLNLAFSKAFLEDISSFKIFLCLHLEMERNLALLLAESEECLWDSSLLTLE